MSRLQKIDLRTKADKALAESLKKVGFKVGNDLAFIEADSKTILLLDGYRRLAVAQKVGIAEETIDINVFTPEGNVITNLAEARKRWNVVINASEAIAHSFELNSSPLKIKKTEVDAFLKKVSAIKQQISFEYHVEKAKGFDGKEVIAIPQSIFALCEADAEFYYLTPEAAKKLADEIYAALEVKQ